MTVNINFTVYYDVTLGYPLTLSRLHTGMQCAVLFKAIVTFHFPNLGDQQ